MISAGLGVYSLEKGQLDKAQAAQNQPAAEKSKATHEVKHPPNGRSVIRKLMIISPISVPFALALKIRRLWETPA